MIELHQSSDDSLWERLYSRAYMLPFPRTDSERARVAHLLADMRFNNWKQGERHAEDQAELGGSVC